MIDGVKLKRLRVLHDERGRMMERLRAPLKLSSLGVKAEEIPGIARRGMGRSTAWNPRPMTEGDIVEICKTIL